MKKIIILACLLLMTGCLDQEQVRGLMIEKHEGKDLIFWESPSNTVVFQMKNEEAEKCELWSVMFDHEKITSEKVAATMEIQYCESMTALKLKIKELEKVKQEFEDFKQAVCPQGEEFCFYR